jgi:hypothetical protein
MRLILPPPPGEWEVQVSPPALADGEELDGAVWEVTVDGWPWQWRLHGARLVARFQLVHFVAWVTVTGGEHDAIRHWLSQARPDFRTPAPAALADFWRADWFANS